MNHPGPSSHLTTVILPRPSRRSIRTNEVKTAVEALRMFHWKLWLPEERCPEWTTATVRPVTQKRLPWRSRRREGKRRTLRSVGGVGAYRGNGGRGGLKGGMCGTLGPHGLKRGKCSLIGINPSSAESVVLACGSQVEGGLSIRESSCATDSSGLM
jgi:hypothetical protein